MRVNIKSFHKPVKSSKAKTFLLETDKYIKKENSLLRIKTPTSYVIPFFSKSLNSTELMPKDK